MILLELFYLFPTIYFCWVRKREIYIDFVGSCADHYSHLAIITAREPEPPLRTSMQLNVCVTPPLSY